MDNNLNSYESFKKDVIIILSILIPIALVLGALALVGIGLLMAFTWASQGSDILEDGMLYTRVGLTIVSVAVVMLISEKIENMDEGTKRNISKVGAVLFVITIGALILLLTST